MSSSYFTVLYTSSNLFFKIDILENNILELVALEVSLQKCRYEKIFHYFLFNLKKMVFPYCMGVKKIWLIRSEEKKFVKGTDRLCKVIKLSMQCCGQILWDSFETYETFPRCIISEFECIVDVQNHEFGWVRFQNQFF